MVLLLIYLKATVTVGNYIRMVRYLLSRFWSSGNIPLLVGRIPEYVAEIRSDYRDAKYHK